VNEKKTVLLIIDEGRNSPIRPELSGILNYETNERSSSDRHLRENEFGKILKDHKNFATGSTSISALP